MSPSTAIQSLTNVGEDARRVDASFRGATAGAPRWHVARDARPADSQVANDAVLRERARLSRDLHDGVLQTFYAITLTASRARKLLDQSEDYELRHMLDDLVQLANTGGSELRALVTNIRSDRLTSGGLTAGLANLATEVRTRHGLNIRLSLADEPDLPATTKEALLLIAHEALRNVIRHANADRVDLVLDVLGQEIVLLITDDGRGFDTRAFRPAHFGLHSMRERAAAVEGILEVVSAAAIGTQVRVCIPTHKEPA